MFTRDLACSSALLEMPGVFARRWYLLSETAVLEALVRADRTLQRTLHSCLFKEEGLESG